LSDYLLVKMVLQSEMIQENYNFMVLHILRINALNLLCRDNS